MRSPSGTGGPFLHLGLRPPLAEPVSHVAAADEDGARARHTGRPWQPVWRHMEPGSRDTPEAILFTVH